MSEGKKKLFSVVVPVYGNEKNIPITIPYFVSKLDLFPKYDVEIILVCDGSPDNSFEEMKKMHERYPGLIRIASFTRNFGQGPAIHCGMKMARGDVIGVISCDMQDPFELFADMLAAWEEGYKFVIATRMSRNEHGICTSMSKLLHKLANKYIDSRYPVGGFDFFLIDRVVVEPFCGMDTANGMIQMVLIWLGYKYKAIEYVRQERKTGKSGYGLWKKITIAIGLFTTYSPILSQIWGFLGGAMGAIGGLAFIVLLILQACGHQLGVALIISFLAFCTGLILCAAAALGEYIWRAFDNTKRRPRYVLDEMYD